MSRPRRVRVVGNSGSGKTTFAVALATRLGVPHLELDEVFWDAGWTQRDLDAALDGADAIVWLDYPRRVVMPRIVRRTLVRGVTRRELWHGNRERLGNLLSRDPEQNIVRWAWTQHDAYRGRYAFLAASGAPVIRLASPRAARRWLASLTTS